MLVSNFQLIIGEEELENLKLKQGSAALEPWGTPGISAGPPELQQLEDREGQATLEEDAGLLSAVLSELIIISLSFSVNLPECFLYLGRVTCVLRQICKSSKIAGELLMLLLTSAVVPCMGRK